MFKVDATVIEMFLQGECESNIKSHWIFSRIKDGETLFDMPPKESSDHIKIVYEQILTYLENFQPRNNQLFNSIFPDAPKGKAEAVNVYLIIGAPKPYDAMCRMDADGRLCIIFDLVRINEYCSNADEIQDIMSNLITHELTHIYLHRNYRGEDYSNHFQNELRYITFDEGFAHYLSISDNSLTFDFKKYNDKWEAAILKLKKAYTYRGEIDEPEKLLYEANAGSFWDKFGAISGMYSIFMYVNESANPYDKFVELYRKGPYFLNEYLLTSL